MINVFLIGDSIRMNYQKDVIKRLGVKYDVYAPEENCRFSMYTLCQISTHWIKEVPPPDIIHWNNGLWDVLRRFPEDGCFTPIDEYLRNMERIHRQLKKTGAKIIFATTTPTMFFGKLTPNGCIWDNKDIEYYNKRITELLENRVDAINDLYNLVLPRMKECICEDLVHLSETGKAVLGQAVADIITKLSN